MYQNYSAMRQLTLQITDKKYPLFIELIKSLDFVKKIEEEPTKEEILANLTESIKQVNKIKKGQLKGISAKDLLNEL